MPSYRSGNTTNAHANNYDSQGRIMDNSTLLNQKQGVLQPSHNAAWQFKYGNQDIPGAESVGASLLTPPIGLMVDEGALSKKQKDIAKQENKIKKGLLANISNVEYALEGDIYAPDEVEVEEAEGEKGKEGQGKKSEKDKAKEPDEKEGDGNTKLPEPSDHKKESWLGKEVEKLEENIFGKEKKQPDDEKKSKPK